MQNSVITDTLKRQPKSPFLRPQIILVVQSSFASKMFSRISNHISQQQLIEILHYQRLHKQRYYGSFDMLHQLTPEMVLKCQLRWKNNYSKTPKGMICEHCEQLVPDRVMGLYKCVRCPAKYCSKEHQKAASRFHHRYCTRIFQESASTVCINTLPSPIKLNTDDIEDGDQRVTYEHATSLNQNLNIAKYVVENLRKYGHCVLDNFHGEKIAKAVLNEVKVLHHQGSFDCGQLQSTTGHGTSNRRVREDEITWLNGSEQGCKNISHHMSITDTLLQLCNFFIKENKIEIRSPAMVACYPGSPGRGTGYKRHIDNPNKDGRLITTLYYLNPGWDVQNDGGILKLYPEAMFFPDSDKTEIEIEPVFDRLLLFWSDKRNPHEVCPAYKTRYAITLWYFDSDERKKFFEKQKEKSQGGEAKAIQQSASLKEEIHAKREGIQ